MSRILEGQVHDNKQGCKGFLVTEILLPADNIHGSSDSMILSDVQEATRLVSMEDQENDDELSVEMYMRADEPVEKVVWIFKTYKILVIAVALLCKHSAICKLSTILENRIVWMMLRPLLKTGYLPFQRSLSSLIS